MTPAVHFAIGQNEEGMIQASGTELAPGILRCSQPAKTIFDTGSDTGTFLGIAVYEENGDTVLRPKW
jgi:hypothetical protein